MTGMHVIWSSLQPVCPIPAIRMIKITRMSNCMFSCIYLSGPRMCGASNGSIREGVVNKRGTWPVSTTGCGAPRGLPEPYSLKEGASRRPSGGLIPGMTCCRQAWRRQRS